MKTFRLDETVRRAQGPRFTESWLGDGSPFFNVGVHVWEPGEEWRLHMHPQDELFYYAEGQVLVRAGDEEKVVEPGTWVFVPGNVKHGSRNIGPGRAVIMTFNSPNLGWRGGEQVSYVRWAQ